MSKKIGLSLGLCLLSALSGAGLAQTDTSTPPPKILVIQREFVKPGKSGSLHAKSESAFVRAMAAAKWPVHYLGMDSVTGVSRSLFFTGYDSFAAWEKDQMNTEHNTALSDALDRASIADGELLTGYEGSVYLYHEEYSLGAGVNIATMRYFEITRFKVKPGHEKEWDELVKMYREGFSKAVPDARWAVFESMYGSDNGGVYIVLTPMKSLAEVDTEIADSKKFEASMGASGMKRLGELMSACVQESQINLFHLNPKMSYVSDDYIKTDPSFWKPRPAAALKKEVATPQ
jgi:hypothetical protein